jgi:hypothetical protein
MEMNTALIQGTFRSTSSTLNIGQNIRHTDDGLPFFQNGRTRTKIDLQSLLAILTQKSTAFNVKCKKFNELN